MCLVKSFLLTSGFILAALEVGAPGEREKVALSRQVLTENEPEISIPQSQNRAVFSSWAATPYLLLHTGAREADNNGPWGRHAVQDASGIVHLIYGIFENAAGLNNTYVYNAFNCPDSAGRMLFSDGSEPVSPVSDATRGPQNGEISITPGGFPVWTGRLSITGPSGTDIGAVVNYDLFLCSGLLTVDTVTPDPVGFNGFTEPKIYCASESVWMVLGTAEIIGSAVLFSRTTDRGETWSFPEVLFENQAFVGQYAITGEGNTVWAANLSDFDFDLERQWIWVKKSTDGGTTWSPEDTVVEYGGEEVLSPVFPPPSTAWRCR